LGARADRRFVRRRSTWRLIADRLTLPGSPFFRTDPLGLPSRDQPVIRR